MILNPHFHISGKLRGRLNQTAEKFLQEILKSPAILRTILRPNLPALIEPIIKAKREGKIRAVCIYSNTWTTFAVHFGKALIETVFVVPGLFDCVVDSSHPLREGDYKEEPARESCHKTFKVLKGIFRHLCGVKGPIRPSDILFVDEREELHLIKNEGVTYLKPTVFSPFVSDSVKRDVYEIGRSVSDSLFNSPEFLESDIVQVIKYGPNQTYVPIDSLTKLLDYIKMYIQESGLRVIPFIDDTREIGVCLEKFLKRF